MNSNFYRQNAALTTNSFHMLKRLSSIILAILLSTASGATSEPAPQQVLSDLNKVLEQMAPKKPGVPEKDGSLINENCDLPFIFYMRHQFKTHPEVATTDELLNLEIAGLSTYIKAYEDPINTNLVVQDFAKALKEAPLTPPIDVLSESLRNIWPQGGGENFLFVGKAINYQKDEWLVVELSTEVTISLTEKWVHTWTADFKVNDEQTYELQKVQIKSVAKRQDLRVDIERWIDFDSSLTQTLNEPKLSIPNVSLKLTLEARQSQLTHALKNCSY